MRILPTPNKYLLYRVVFRNQLFLKKTLLNQGMFLKILQMRYRERKTIALKVDGGEFL
jgi:hypothetical protein